MFLLSLKFAAGSDSILIRKGKIILEFCYSRGNIPKCHIDFQAKPSES